MMSVGSHITPGRGEKERIIIGSDGIRELFETGKCLISIILLFGLYMNGTHQVLAYADAVNLIGDDIRTIERNSDVLLSG